MTHSTNETVVDELIEERRRVYGDPVETFPRIAEMWRAYIGDREIQAADVPVMLMLMKTVRLGEAPDYSDNSDDIEGYLDIFRQIVGEDMVHARSVDEYVTKKYGGRR